MSIIYVLIPIAMLFVLIAVSIVFWAVKSEQFDDLDRQSVSILFDEDDSGLNTNNSANDNSSSVSSTANFSADSAITNTTQTNHSQVSGSLNTDAVHNNTVEPVLSSTTHTKPE
ncbi:cbb3-type cytochrome oxidase assembly protein CcoS [Shewanella sp. SG41-4]|nr:cbb3-type cytochrome oxidase assembly protein CcoS [Shewanella sp. SG41-4]MBB1440340.1 cbb3-type cytochrome oxidase assembly protein CcoS [Shewanella sp. SG41-4]